MEIYNNSKKILRLLLMIVLLTLNNIAIAQSFKETLEWIDVKVFKTKPTYMPKDCDVFIRGLKLKDDSLIFENRAYRDIHGQGRKLIFDYSVTFDPKDINFNNIKLSYSNNCGWIKFSSNNDDLKFYYKQLTENGYVRYRRNSFLIGFSESSIKEYPQILERMRTAWVNLVREAGGKGEIF